MIIFPFVFQYTFVIVSIFAPPEVSDEITGFPKSILPKKPFNMWMVSFNKSLLLAVFICIL